METNWFKKHADTLAVISIMVGGFYWMDAKIEKVNDRLTAVEKDMGIVKAVMLMKNILPPELAQKE
jgi:hypothetical protein